MRAARDSVLGSATLPSADQRFRADLLRWTARLLLGCTPGAIREATIVLGELLTNAYHHARPPFHVSISTRRDGYVLRLAVADAAPAPSTRWAPGKGLFVVRGLCRTWVVEPRDGGKTVWADLPVLVPPAAEHPDAAEAEARSHGH